MERVHEQHSISHHRLCASDMGVTHYPSGPPAAWHHAGFARCTIHVPVITHRIWFVGLQHLVRLERLSLQIKTLGIHPMLAMLQVWVCTDVVCYTSGM